MLLFHMSSVLEDSVYKYYSVDSVVIEDMIILADSVKVNCKYIHNGKNVLNIGMFRGDLFKDTTVVLDVEMYVKAWKAKRGIKKYEIIREDDIEETVVPYVGDLITNSIVGKESKKSINKGRIFRKGDVGDITIVRKNTECWMILEGNGVFVKKRVVSLDDGSLNDTVRVVDSHGNYFRCVVDKEYVKMIRRETDNIRKKKRDKT